MIQNFDHWLKVSVFGIDKTHFALEVHTIETLVVDHFSQREFDVAILLISLVKRIKFGHLIQYNADLFHRFHFLRLFALLTHSENRQTHLRKPQNVLYTHLYRIVFLIDCLFPIRKKLRKLCAHLVQTLWYLIVAMTNLVLEVRAEIF